MPRTDFFERSQIFCLWSLYGAIIGSEQRCQFQEVGCLLTSLISIKKCHLEVGPTPYPDVVNGQMESDNKLHPLFSFLKTARVEKG